ncbi:hypothetical protein [Wielerella bovis]|uniref:hypothetical protein n=1 Tax=Wielerella bovis TaxID=2917790 RepID=UPI002018C260|nr:hypothetical protein [Wielerella bovis]ULJ60822.1 hypothetical protein MIS44_02870 [Wielerella bovis]
MTIREDDIEREMEERNICFICHNENNENGDCPVCNNPSTYGVNFQFGDRVYHPEYGNGIFLKKRGHSAFLLKEFNSFDDFRGLFVPIEDLELIPHPDTVRLDWLEKNQFELGTHYDDDGLGFIDLRYVVYQPDKQGCRIKLSDEKSYRQAIDKAMQQEQEK